MLSHLRTMWLVFIHLFRKKVTIEYPEEKVVLHPRYRGRIVLTKDPDGGER
jgi:NADH-quinone oxidoreductase subunit I